MPDPALLVASMTLALSALAVLLGVLILRRLSATGLSERAFAGQLDALDDAIGRTERSQREEFRLARDEAGESQRALREEVSLSVTRLAEALGARLREAGTAQRQQLDEFALQLRRSAADVAQAQKDSQEAFGVRLTGIGETNARAGEALKTAMEAQLQALRQDNEAKLEQMRATVDEKLQGTLEQRLGESFKLVSERLEAVHKGLGEMQTLATGVGDLKRVLTNVKSRGTWGEVQLGALLEQMLVPAQYIANAPTGGRGGERVEYAIRLPGGDGEAGVLVPVDSKFPIEDYERLQAASESGDAAAVEVAAKALENRIRASAREIGEKYINPPTTTDFAVLFLPTEGLYAEVVRRPGLFDDLQRLHRITVAGPTTLTAYLSSLQMGFRTLAIQKRSSEVWQVLGGVKAEFGRFGPVLDAVKKKLDAASNDIERISVRRRAMDRKLRGVEAVEFGPAIAMQIADEGEDAEPVVEAAQ